MNFEKMLKWIQKSFSKVSYLKYVGLVVLGIAFLFALNIFAAHTFKGGSDFYVKWSSLNILQQEEKINPYSYQAFQKISENTKTTTLLTLSEDDAFHNPIYSLFLYYPLLFIKNFDIARAVWMTCSMAFFLYIFWNQYLAHEEKNKKEIIFLIVFLLTNIFSIISFLAGDLHIVSFALILLAFQNVKEEKYELAGIFCALATVTPGIALAGMVIIAALSIKKHNGGFFIWFLITTVLLCLAGFLIEDGWTIQFLQSTIKMLQNILPDLNPGKENIIQMIEIGIPFFLLLIEWIRSFNQLDQMEKTDWLFNITLVLFVLIMGIKTTNLSILFLPAWLQIFNEWKKRESENALRIGYVNLIIYIGLSVAMIFIKPEVLVREINLPQVLFLIAGFHVLLNLYWIRPWVFQDTMRNFIKPE